MGKNALHSLLAVENDLKAVSVKVKNEAITTFTKKDDHFEGLIKTYEPMEEDATETSKTEHKEIVTTVADKLNYIKSAISKGLNAQLSKEETNSSGTAKASLVVDGVDFGELSATSLLSLEKEMVAIRRVYSSIPTLDPAKPWKKDEMGEGDQYVTDPSVTFRTSKKEDFIIVVEPTEFHPAHIEKVTKDVTVGKYLTTYKSGKITPLAKSKLLERVDNITLAVKRARSKANQAEVISVKVGTDLLSFINKDLI